MRRHTLPFRQVHLDFHTSPAIPGIGAAFNKAEWQETLRRGHVDSITLFSKCHHGWTYHPTKVGRTHPHLKFDLLRAQMDACAEIGVKTPVYLSAGIDNLASAAHPEWREVDHEGRYTGWARSVTEPGFHKMCFNSPYLDYLCDQIEEAVRLFPDANGVFLDIISQNLCCCKWCMAVMEREGLCALQEADRRRCSEIALARYYERATAACRRHNPDMPVFHNSGHVAPGRRGLLPFFSHLELESLPTGGWGYDHFPLSAAYSRCLGVDFLGMTGKFHTTWGEFGGYKHPNALRYECAAMLAQGAKCSVGDQLHPNGRLDPSTYAIIGKAYEEVERKEPFCEGAVNLSEVGLLSIEGLTRGAQRETPADVGASRVLLESHLLFDVLDIESDFSPYKLIIVPDAAEVCAGLRDRLASHVARGGRLLLTGKSGVDAASRRLLFDLGAEYHGESPFLPDYVLPAEGLRPGFIDSPMVMYMRSQRIKATDGQSLGQVYDPYFNRSYKHFCSHQHTPCRPEPSGYDAGVQRDGVLYLAHPVFSIYRLFGAVAVGRYAANAIRRLLGPPMVETNMPSTARVALTEQRNHSRFILHLLYAPTVLRGGAVPHLDSALGAASRPVEIIEDLPPLHGVEAAVRPPAPVRRATLEPQGVEVPVEPIPGGVRVRLDSFSCHQMVALHTA